MKRLTNFTFSLLSVLTALILINCSSNQPKFGQRSRVDDSGKQPSWVKDAKDSWEKGDRIYFRSFITDQTDLSMGMEASKAKGIKDVAEKVNMQISTELGFNEEGNSSRQGTIGKYLKSAMASETNQLNLGGFQAEESFWERYSVAKPEGVEYVYDIYRSFSITKSDYAQAKADLLNKGKHLAQNALDHKAEADLDRLMKKNSAATN